MSLDEVRIPLRRVAALTTALALLAVTAVPALADSPAPVDPNAMSQAIIAQVNPDGLQQAAMDQANGVIAGIPGVGTAAPPITVAVPVVTQVDVKVDASINPGKVSQTTSNAADVAQAPTATSGTATGSTGGISIAGGAISGAIGVVTQVNVEIAAGYIPSGGVTQDATNTAAVAQAPSASAGNASSTGSGGIAQSGTALSLATANVNQFNLLLFLGLDPNATGSVAQSVANGAFVGQAPGAASGSVATSGTGLATSGVALNTSNASIPQTNTLLSW